jgi:malto-oligosyltrehalose trehalohydrolase
MNRMEDGWHQAEIDTKPFGQDYIFVLSDGTTVPDPASRRQIDVLGLSTLIDPNQNRWTHEAWQGRPWEEAVFYEFHVGTFTLEGTFRAAIGQLHELADIGFTAIEIMPLAHFPGRRGWGYDGVFHYAPFNPYGSADDLKAFVDAAHGLGLMVFLDVVYNHFGPTGNFLPKYAPGFFHEDNPTPWGSRIAFANEPVRRFFIENAIYWLTEYRLDGLRLDAIDQIDDDSDVHFLAELSRETHAAVTDRTIHLITENPANGTDLMAETEYGTRLYKADWNDDFHHAIHSAVTRENSGYYGPLSKEPWKNAGRALAQGHLRQGKRILPIEPPHPSCLPTTSYVHFLQNHDQVGNRARGDRLHVNLERNLYMALVEMLVLSPQIPLFFMGDDHLSSRPFRFFADYEGKLRSDVWKNREREALNFGGFPEGFGAEDIPDPSDPTTFENCKLDWSEQQKPDSRKWRSFLQHLFKVRSTEIVPMLGSRMRGGEVLDAPDGCIFVDWIYPGGALKLRANFSSSDVSLSNFTEREIYPNAGSMDKRVLRRHGVRMFKR